MTQQPAFASIRQGDMPANQAWELLLPVVDTNDHAVAVQICDVLRSWTWKALDRRRRDVGLREWIDLLNRVEAFFAEDFSALAAKIEALIELLHESLAVAELAQPDILLRRKHILPILTALAERDGEWIERGQLMAQLKLKAANMTRLMTVLLDTGWAELSINGREASYRASAEGIRQARSAADCASFEILPEAEIVRLIGADRHRPLLDLQIWDSTETSRSTERWAVGGRRRLPVAIGWKSQTELNREDEFAPRAEPWLAVAAGMIGAFSFDPDEEPDDEDDEALAKDYSATTRRSLAAVGG